MSTVLRKFKFLFVGKPDVGKKTYLLTYTNKVPPDRPLIRFDEADVLLEYKDQLIKIALFNSLWDESYLTWLPLTYPGTDIFMLCFSVVSLQSLEFIRNVCVPNIEQHYPNRPYVLVGLKSDLIEEYQNQSDYEKKFSIIPRSKIEEVKNIIGARAYIECSSFHYEHIEDAFFAGLDIVLSDDYIPPKLEKVHKSKCKTH
ncbi:rac-like GTP-binding protein ARAC7 [Histomonas meleagridis]|uniref:rac-like GTP-binding protein ARAC7 n=1 Tax=Histomonas meleagridis TaxID=135588 RepID=UPI003559A3BD|nr:rac-like GTP-binding protein ARAC7 [Histomonas meleagridis]KAH0803621.1 rac-like GTP-binding protein ARAC7 [Histomonas meleagridis]